MATKEIEKRDIVISPEGTYHYEGDTPSGVIVAFVGAEDYSKFEKQIDKESTERAAKARAELAKAVAEKEKAVRAELEAKAKEAKAAAEAEQGTEGK